MKSGVFDLREKISAQLNGGSKKIEPEPRLSLDIPSERGRIDESPPIRFRIEWAGCQGLVTASWQLAHLNFLIHFRSLVSHLKRLARMLLYLVLFGYLALVLVGLFLSDKLIFQPQRSSYKDDSNVIKLRSADGKSISAIYLPNPAAKFTVLYSHGNAEDIGDLRPWLEKLQQSGFSVFAYDYHGYGTSEGITSEHTVYLDADAAYSYLTTTLHLPAQ